MDFHVIVARYEENIDWLFNVLRKHTNWRTTIYNDGSLIYVPSEVQDRVNLFNGDKIPAESTKYLRFIIDNYETLESNERLIFTQADPIYHNYTFCEVLEHTDKWNVNFQNLCLCPHPPPWGCGTEILKGSAPNITWFSDNARVWSDTDMDDFFRGKYFADDSWLCSYNRNTSVSKLCSEWGIQIPRHVDKCYCALFSTNWNSIKRVPLSTWNKLMDFNIHGNADTRHMTQKLRACILESMWAVLLTIPRE
jgi:hypothetical protein